MSDKELSWRFLEERVVESPAVERARRASLEHGIDPITASAGQYIAHDRHPLSMPEALLKWELV